MVMASKQNEGHWPSAGRYLDQEKVRKALDSAQTHGATYAEVRVVALTESSVAMRDGALERAIPPFFANVSDTLFAVNFLRAKI